MQYRLAYGTGSISIDLPEQNVVKVFEIKSSVVLPDPRKEIQDKLQFPTASKPLSKIAADKKTACIVVSDSTRPVPNKIILPPILETLENSGIERSNILILVATGLHKPSTQEEKLEMLGQEILNDYRVEDHDARNQGEHDYLGKTKNEIPVWIDRRYLAADIKILTGLIEPHFMAGFSGGRKSICPGIASIETISAWHSPRFIEHANAKFGCIKGNPIHAEQLEIVEKAGCDFIVNVVINHERQILNVVAGDCVQAHAAGVHFARQVAFDTVQEPVDVVVTSSAGYPLDKTLYQSIKGIVAAIDILKPGGTVILAASCDEGLGSMEFEEIAQKFASIDDFMHAICSGDFFVVNQWQMEELAKALKKGKVKVVTRGMKPEELRQYYLEPIESVEQAVAEAIDEYGPETRIAVLPDGPYVLAELNTAQKKKRSIIP